MNGRHVAPGPAPGRSPGQRTGAFPSSALRLLAWALLGVPGFAAGWATMQTMGEVVGEAWGGAFLHALGHAAGSVLFIALLSASGLLASWGHRPWVTRSGVAATLAAAGGFVAFLPVLAYAPDSLEDLTLALTLFLPLAAAALAQCLALRGRIDRPALWAFGWSLAVVGGVGVAWFAGGGLEGVVTFSVHPVWDRSVEYWWGMVPTGLLGGVAYAAAIVALLPVSAPAASEAVTINPG